MSNSVSSVEGEINAIVKEYLTRQKLKSTLKVFEEECQHLNKPILDNVGNSQNDERIGKIKSELLDCFDNGQRVEFFTLWESHVMPHSRDSECEKLEFYLHLYFAIFPITTKDREYKVVETIKESMYSFRHYIETKGSSLSQTPEFLPYYALPFVPNPMSHPSFQGIFEETWTGELRKKLESCITSTFNRISETAESRLVELYNCNNVLLKDACQELQMAKKRLLEAEKKCTQQTRQLKYLQEDYQKLVSISSDLITALESAIKGNLVDLDEVLSSFSQRYPDMFEIQSDSGFETGGPFLGSMRNFQNTVNRSARFSLAPLDFAKIKKDLLALEARKKALLLQALRWRLTRTVGRAFRNSVVLTYIESDLLGCEAISEYRQRLFCTLQSPSEHLRQTLTRFLNALASFSAGRSYLAKCPQLLSVLQGSLINNELTDLITRDMTLGLLQKLSLRKPLLISMIEGGMLEWLVTTLDSHQLVLTDYGLEYATALLMNLCLRSAGRRRCVPIAQRVLSVIITLLKHSNPEILLYVNGTLYSLLSVPKIKEVARDMQLEMILQDEIERGTFESRRQLQYVLRKFSADELQDERSSDEESDDMEDEEEVEIEPEIEKNDPLIALPGELSGEKLLLTNYILPQTRSYEEHTWLDNIDGILAPTTHSSPHAHTTSTQSPLRKAALNALSSRTHEGSSVKHTEDSLPPKLPTDIDNYDAQEYAIAFQSRPKIPRTPEPSSPSSSCTSSPMHSCLHKRGKKLVEENDCFVSSISPKVAACSPPYSPRHIGQTGGRSAILLKSPEFG